MPEHYIIDFDHQEVNEGSRVRLWDFKEDHPDWGKGPETDAHYYGTVIGFDDWEGDVDDEGRSISIPPRVKVRFDDGEEQWFTTTEWTYGPYPEREPEEGKVEELSVVV